jgi:hypothetical protein
MLAALASAHFALIAWCTDVHEEHSYSRLLLRRLFQRTSIVLRLSVAAVAAEHAELQQKGKQVFLKALQGESVFDRWGSSTAQDKLLVGSRQAVACRTLQQEVSKVVVSLASFIPCLLCTYVAPYAGALLGITHSVSCACV